MAVLKLYDTITLDIYSALSESVLELPFIEGGISAGFPSPALDFIDLKISFANYFS